MPAVAVLRAFLAPHNFAGFGSGDVIALSASVAALLAFFAAPPMKVGAGGIARNRLSSMLALALFAICSRLALLATSPVPTPSGSDDFGYILLADTLRHLRLANPAHALPQFFEQIFVLQRPTYSSMFNLGQGMVLALGWALFRHPWAGVLLASGALCAGCYWMLRGWTSPGWAFIGGLLAFMQFGPLCYWTNSYWGGAVSACAGCLVFGALPRFAKQTRPRYAALLGLGFALQLLTRPYEFLWLAISAGLFLPLLWRRDQARLLTVHAAITMGLIGCAGVLVLLQNKSVTGSWRTTPYLLYRYQYGVPATFTFQRNPVPHAQLNQEQEIDYKAETIIHGDGPETFRDFAQRLVFRARFCRFFLLPPLYIAALAYLLTMRSYRQLWPLLTILLFALGSNFYPYFYPHYIAAVACLFVLIGVQGLERLNNFRPYAGFVLFFICAVQFMFWYSIHAFTKASTISELSRFESWDFINYGDPQGRRSIDSQLSAIPGKLLVIVHYGPTHGFEEWVHNSADIDSSRVVWAHDLGPDEDEKLRQYYPDRRAMLLKPDEAPPSLIRYPTQTGPFKDVQ